MSRMSLLIGLAAALALPTGLAAQDSRAPAPAAAPKPVTDDAASRMVCRRVEVTGSLVKREKVCKPAKEWAKIISNGNDAARAVVESGMACAGGPTCNPQGL